MKKVLFLLALIGSVGAHAAVDISSPAVITCTAIKGLFEGELVVRIAAGHGPNIPVKVTHVRRVVAQSKTIGSSREANLRNDLFGGRIEHDVEGNQVFDGVFLRRDSADLRVILALNGFLNYGGQRLYHVVRPASKLILRNPAWGEFEITSCSN